MSVTEISKDIWILDFKLILYSESLWNRIWKTVWLREPFRELLTFSVSRSGYSPYILIMLSSLLLVHILYNTFVLLLYHYSSTFDRFVRVSRFFGLPQKPHHKKYFEVGDQNQRRRWDTTNTRNVNNVHHSADCGNSVDSCNHITKKIRSLRLIEISKNVTNFRTHTRRKHKEKERECTKMQHLVSRR